MGNNINLFSLTDIHGYTLRSGKSKSCGCLRKEVASNSKVDDLTGLVDMKSAIIGDEKDNKDPTKKTFESGDKTLWGAYNALLDKDEEVKSWAQN